MERTKKGYSRCTLMFLNKETKECLEKIAKHNRRTTTEELRIWLEEFMRVNAELLKKINERVK